MITRVKFVVPNRLDILEDIMIIFWHEEEERQEAIGIDGDELKDMASVMERLKHMSFSNVKYENAYEIIADAILENKL